MKLNHEPTKGEVCMEILERGVDYLDSKVESVIEFSKFALGIGGIVLCIPYMIPTTVRKCNESTENSSSLSLSQKMGGWTGITGGSLINIWELMSYGSVSHDHPEILALPIATNIASGMYEIGRHTYNKARQQLIRKRSGDISDLLEN